MHLISVYLAGPIAVTGVCVIVAVVWLWLRAKSDNQNLLGGRKIRKELSVIRPKAITFDISFQELGLELPRYCIAAGNLGTILLIWL